MNYGLVLFAPDKDAEGTPGRDPAPSAAPVPVGKTPSWFCNGCPDAANCINKVGHCVINANQDATKK